MVAVARDEAMTDNREDGMRTRTWNDLPPWTTVDNELRAIARELHARFPQAP
jgi:hypothetical protein